MVSPPENVFTAPTARCLVHAFPADNALVAGGRSPGPSRGSPPRASDYRLSSFLRDPDLVTSTSTVAVLLLLLLLLFLLLMLRTSAAFAVSPQAC